MRQRSGTDWRILSMDEVSQEVIKTENRHLKNQRNFELSRFFNYLDVRPDSSKFAVFRSQCAKLCQRLERFQARVS